MKFEEVVQDLLTIKPQPKNLKSKRPAKLGKLKKIAGNSPQRLLTIYILGFAKYIIPQKGQETGFFVGHYSQKYVG